jgi:peptidoglycan-associated lipoprotein
MLGFMREGRGLKLAATVCAALVVSACARKDPAELVARVGGAATPGSAQEFMANVGDRVWFMVDQSELTSEARGTLDRQAQWLQRYPAYRILIEGHADERGTREYNLALGARRSTTVRNYLASRGINPSRMRTISYGKERPAQACDDESCWTQNRRAVTVIDIARGS